MKTLFSLLCFSLVACSQSYTPYLEVDPRFDALVKDFENEANAHGLNLKIDNLIFEFTDKLVYPKLGTCAMYDHATTGVPTISINEKWWNGATATSRKVVSYHELLHCVRFREHVLTFNGPNGNITSIMYPYLLNDKVYLDNWEYYMYEAFHGN